MSGTDLIKGYPKYLRESIQNVEKTRERRLKESFELMSLDERDELLKTFHPDYRKEGKRQVKFGPNKGDLMPHEVVDILEAHPLVDPNTIDLSPVDFDVSILIIGGGGGGMTAALWALYSGVNAEDILIVQKLRLMDSNSVMSQGGIQAADKTNDSPTMHYLDIIGGGHFTNNPELVRTLVMDAPLIIKWHEELGVMYDRVADGTMSTLSGGGASRKRMHSARDYTGMEIVRNLKDEILNKNLPVLEFTSAVELIMDEYDQVAGAVLYDMETHRYHVVRAKLTILATGGFGRLHIQGFQTTNHYGATGDGVALACHVGAKLKDLDSVQYHPTGAAYPEQIVGLLVTEKVRNLGAQPVNRNGDQFVYPLEPRDVEASAIIRECYERNKGIETPTGMRGVWLDSPMIEIIHGEGTISKLLPAMYRQNIRFDIDMTKDPILVFPTLHFQNGGIEMINDKTETSVSGLLACGEVTGGVHGKNRLMGNSILEYSVYGRRAGIFAAKRAQKVKLGKLSLDHVGRYKEMLKETGVKTTKKAPILLPEYRGEGVLSRALNLL
ncbi:MAG: FAD-binding protein [Candidatus Bathyarchaeota archaeon]|nr:MAG: FAD-binding protein [Candidatus Bathyarchaeota archaeon]